MIKRARILTVFLLFFISISNAEHFLLKWHLNDGVDWFYGTVMGADSDHDGWQEVFLKSETLGYPVIFEQTAIGPELATIIDSCIYLYPWAVGDFDQDSMIDVLMEFYAGQGNYDSVRVYESVSPDSLPGTFVWKDHLYGSEYSGISNLRTWGDMDGNGKFNFFNMRYGILYVYENVEDNHYELVVNDTFIGANFQNPTVGDFDGDGRVDIISVGNGFWAIESTGEHLYELILYDTL